MKKKYALIGLIIILVGSNILMWGILGYEQAYANKIYPGVWYQDQNLSNLTLDEAQTALEPAKTTLLDKKITLKIGDTEQTPTLAELGYIIDTQAMVESAYSYGREANLQKFISLAFSWKKPKEVDLVYRLDESTLKDYLSDRTQGAIRNPKDMTLAYKNGAVEIIPAEDGVEINQQVAVAAIESQINPLLTTTVTVEPIRKTPTITSLTQIEKAKASLEKTVAQPLIVQAESETFQIKPETLFAMSSFQVKDNELVLDYDQTKVKNEITAIAKKFDLSPMTKKVSTRDGSTLDEGRDGRKLNQDEATKLVIERLTNSDLTTPLVLPVTKIERKTTTENPEYELGRYPGRYLEIDLSSQKLFMIDGNELKAQFRVSTGSWDTPTPKGSFFIKNHIRTAWSKKYKLYMPYWMAITEENGTYEGYGIHGLPYWPNGYTEGKSHIGQRVSHGCIRLGPGDEKTVYDWTVDNETRVVIHD